MDAPVLLEDPHRGQTVDRDLDSRRDDGVRRLRPGRLAWLPIPILLAAMIAFWAAGLQSSHESAYLLLVLNLHSVTLVCLFVAYLIARSFLVRGTPGLLLLGCGVVIWGPAGVVATAAARGDANISITIYNSCVWLSGLCHLAGVSLSLRSRRSLSPPALWLPAAYALAAGAVMLVTLATLAGWIPAFFVEEHGGTPVRQAVLMSAIAMFTLTALLLGATKRKSLSAFAYWYALALLLIAAGLLGVMLQTDHASVLGWAGRATQSLGGLYLLIAAIASVRESRIWGISLEAALQQSEDRYRTLVETAPDAIVVHRDGRFLYANSAALSLVGADSFEQLARHTVLDFFRPQERELARERLCMAMAGNRLPPREATLLRVDGQEVAVEFHTAPVDFQGARAVQTIIRDVIERKRAEEELRLAYGRLQTFFDQRIDGIGIVIANAKGDILQANDYYLGILGCTREELASGQVDWRRMTPPEWLPADERALAQLRARGVCDTYEKEYVRRDGSRVPVWLTDATMPGDSGDILAFVLDITERKRAEENLRRSEERFRVAQELSLDAFTILTAVRDEGGRLVDFRWEYVNPEAGRILRHAPAELAGQRLLEVLPGNKANSDLFDRYVRVVETGQPHDYELCYESEGIRGWFRNMTVKLGDGVAICFADITERKQAEAALRELNVTLESKVAQRTAELEHRTRQLQQLALELTQAEDRERQRIAAFLHEDLQQHLAGVKFHLNLLKSQLRNGTQFAAVDDVDAMLREAIEKSRSLSHDLSPAVLHLNDLREVLQWLARRVQTRHGLTVHIDIRGEVILPSEAMTMFLFRATQEMLLNVVKHARVKETRIRVHRVARYLYLSVSDRGSGFDPRALKQTSGFGLLSIRERIGLLGGRMKIRSVKGRGSTVLVAIPDNRTAGAE